MSDEPFGPAYTWCDGECARCPLAADCPGTLPARSSFPISVAAERVRAAGLDYAFRLHTLLCALGAAETEGARRAWAAGMRIAPRATGLTEGASSSQWMLVEALDAECMANLASLCALESELAAPFMQARAALWALLEPLQRDVPETARRTLERLIRAGKAPSPFAIAGEGKRTCA